jgi:4a-hydroxytetrahydrobiopterin dehydratase
MENPLASRRCVPCEGRVSPLPPERVDALLQQICGWKLVEGSRIEKIFKTKAFVDGLDLVNRIGRLAEEENHHPDLLLRWGRVRVSISTHAAGGLTENDFILAAKIDELSARA